jgi:hypothetical protein
MLNNVAVAPQKTLYNVISVVYWFEINSNALVITAYMNLCNGDKHTFHFHTSDL